MTTGLDTLISSLLLSKPAGDLFLPVVFMDLKMETITLNMEGTEAYLMKEDVFPGLLRNYLALRECFIGLHPRLMYWPETNQVTDLMRQLQTVLRPPLVQEGQDPMACITALFAQRRPDITELAARLTSLHFMKMDARGQVSLVSPAEDMRFGTLTHLLGSVKALLNAGAEEFRTLREEMARVPEYRNTIVPLVSEARRFLLEKNLPGLARLIDENLAKMVERNAYIVEQQGLLLLLVALTEKSQETKRLKNIVPNMRKVSDMVQLMLASEKTPVAALEKELRGYERTVLKNFTPNLSDYYGNEELKAYARKVISRFQLKFSHPEILHGRTADEVGINGVLFYGGPGVGKTFFFTCLASEFGMKVFNIVPEEFTRSKKDGQNQLTADDLIQLIEERFKIAEEYAKNNQCIVFLDEFEELCPPIRNVATASQTDKKLIAYLLRRIVRIRMDSPNILLIAATNYLNMIDEAMLRHGRFDVHCELLPPTSKDKKKIIAETIQEEAPSLKLDEGQLNALAGAAEDLLALPIKNALISAIRYLPFEEGRPAGYEDLLKEMREIAASRKKNEIPAQK